MINYVLLYVLRISLALLLIAPHTHTHIRKMNPYCYTLSHSPSASTLHAYKIPLGMYLHIWINCTFQITTNIHANQGLYFRVCVRRICMLNNVEFSMYVRVIWCFTTDSHTVYKTLFCCCCCCADAHKAGAILTHIRDEVA